MLSVLEGLEGVNVIGATASELVKSLLTLMLQKPVKAP